METLTRSKLTEKQLKGLGIVAKTGDIALCVVIGAMLLLAVGWGVWMLIQLATMNWIGFVAVILIVLILAGYVAKEIIKDETPTKWRNDEW